MSVLQAKRPKVKHPSESLTLGLNLTLWLQSGETIISVGSVTSENGLTVGTPAVNAAPFVDDDEETCAIGYGVTYVCSGGAANQNYKVTIVFTTSTGRTLYAIQIVQVRDL